MLRPALLLRPLILYFIIVAILLAGFSVACGSGEDAPASPTATVTPPADAGAIRSIDLSMLPEVQNFARQLGSGRVDKAGVIYADLTADRRDDAIVPVTTDGTLGNIGYIVLAGQPGGGAPQAVLTRTPDRSTAGGLRLGLEEGVLVETAGEFGPQDPFCCPSMLRKTYFRWDGSKLQVAREEHVKNPDAAKP